MSDGSVLIIDDEPEVRQLLRRVAERQGLHVIDTADPVEFRELALSAQPSVIILDLIMPRQDGVELLGFLAEKGVRAHIVLISGYNDEMLTRVRNLASAYGLDVSVLSKPIDLDALRSHFPSSQAQASFGG